MRDAQTGKRPTVREIPSPCRTCACAGRQAESWDMLQGAVRCASRQQGTPDIESALQASRISSTEIQPFGVPYVSEPRRTITVCASRKRQALLEKNL